MLARPCPAVLRSACLIFRGAARRSSDVAIRFSGDALIRSTLRILSMLCVLDDRLPMNERGMIPHKVCIADPGLAWWNGMSWRTVNGLRPRQALSLPSPPPRPSTS